MTSRAMPSLALLAGGLATRLHPLTKSLPKSLVEIAGEPFIAHQLRLLKRQNIENIIICGGFGADQIQAYVGNGENFGVNVSYSLDGEFLLGTGGAIKKALPLLGEHFFVMYGDSYLNADFKPIYNAFQRAKKSLALMTIYRNESGSAESNIIYRNGRIMDYSKQHLTPEMNYIDYGLGLFSALAFDAWKVIDIFDLSDVYQRLLIQDQLAGCEVHKRYYEIGSLQGIKETCDLFTEEYK